MRRREDLAEAAAAIGFPLFIRAPSWTGARGVRNVRDQTALEDAWDAIHPHLKPDDEGTVLIQRAVPGEDVCLAVLAQAGVIKAAMAYRNVQTFPHQAGFGVLRETIDPGPLPRIAEACWVRSAGQECARSTSAGSGTMPRRCRN